jgi:hypothetical protein
LCCWGLDSVFAGGFLDGKVDGCSEAFGNDNKKNQGSDNGNSKDKFGGLSTALFTMKL